MVSIISLEHALENIFSDAGLINSGVPQGSIVGLLLFIIYINGLPQALNKTGSYLYADDTLSYIKINMLL